MGAWRPVPRCWLVWFVLALACVHARAHPALATVASAEIVRTEGDARIEVYVSHDALAYALNDTSVRVSDAQMYALLDGPRDELAAALQDGRERFVSGFRIEADGRRLELVLVGSPDLDGIDRWRLEVPSERLPLKLAFEAVASIPEGARLLTVRAPAVLGEMILGVSRTGVEPIYIPLGPGETSPGLDLSMIWEGAQARSRPGSSSPAPAPERGAAAEDSVGAAGIVWRYLVLGYRHIIPEGHDHELFILGLFLLNIKLRDLLWQTTAFTIAHTTTLTLATFGLVSAPAGVVEPLIALSIAFLAIENLFARKVHPWRLAIAFFFGLVHGLGFASGLREIGIPTAQLISALLAFNVGVEGGHLTILAIAFLTIGWFKDKPWYRARVSIPLSVVIAGVALVWFVQRVG